MNWLNDIGKQVRDLFASMTPSTRIMAGLMLAVVVVSLGWISMSGTTSDHEYLFGGRDFSETELSSWEAAFSEAQLRDFDRVGKRMKVPTGQKDLYLKALSNAKMLPKDFDSYMNEALTMGSPFDPNSLIDKRTVFAKEQRLTHMIQGLSGIEQAYVNYDEQRTGFGRKTDRVCSIAVRGLAGNPVPPAQLRNIAKMATASFAGLSEENITVSDLGNPASFYRGSSDPNATDENPYFAAQTQWEQRYEGKLVALLGDLQARIAVNVTLDPTLAAQSEQLQFQQQPVAIQSTTVSRLSENTKAAPGGQPGAAPNGVSNQATSLTATAAGQNSKTKDLEENERRLAGHEVSVTRTAGLVPKSVYVSIGIPESHYRKVALHRFLLNNPDKTPADAPPPAPGELAEIKLEEEKAVRAAVATIPVGAREGDDRKAYIEVYSFTDLPVPEPVGPSTTQTAMAWLMESWSTLALLGLVVFSFFMMASWVKASAPQAETEKAFADGFGLELPATSIDALDISSGGEDVGPRRKPPAMETSGTEIKEDLSTIIRENPDAAVNLIKAWIGEAA
jgi:flagellar biosynthesis/type III secretory pathway M-ring protein FliF/YscJ